MIHCQGKLSNRYRLVATYKKLWNFLVPRVEQPFRREERDDHLQGPPQHRRGHGHSTRSSCSHHQTGPVSHHLRNRPRAQQVNHNRLVLLKRKSKNSVLHYLFNVNLSKMNPVHHLNAALRVIICVC